MLLSFLRFRIPPSRIHCLPVRHRIIFFPEFVPRVIVLRFAGHCIRSPSTRNSPTSDPFPGSRSARNPFCNPCGRCVADTLTVQRGRHPTRFPGRIPSATVFRLSARIRWGQKYKKNSSFAKSNSAMMRKKRSSTPRIRRPKHRTSPRFWGEKPVRHSGESPVSDHRRPIRRVRSEPIRSPRHT